MQFADVAGFVTPVLRKVRGDFGTRPKKKAAPILSEPLGKERKVLPDLLLFDLEQLEATIDLVQRHVSAMARAAEHTRRSVVAVAKISGFEGAQHAVAVLNVHAITMRGQADQRVTLS